MKDRKEVPVLYSLLVISLLNLIFGCHNGIDPVEKSARYYFVSTTGSDKNPGSETKPFRTIQKAASVVLPGDTVWIRGGEYKEIVTITRGGQKGKTVEFRNYGDEEVIIDGGDRHVPEWNGLLNVKGASYVNISGINVRNSGERGIWLTADAVNSHISLGDCRVKNTAKSAFAIEQVNGCQLINCEATAAGDGYPGFYLFDNKEVVLENCVSHNNGGNGGGLAQGFVFYGGSNYEVRRCSAFENSRDGFDTGGGTVGTQDIQFTDCSSYRNGEDGFGLNSYARNAIYRRCLIYDNDGSGFNIYEGASQVEIDNCTIVGCAHYFWIDGSDDPSQGVENVRVRNCIGYGVQNRGIITIAPFNGISFDYNCWSGVYSGYGAFCLWNMGPGEIPLIYDDIGSNRSWSLQLGQGQHSFAGDPGFVNLSGNDYHLRSDSPCIDKGLNVGLPFSGAAPDMGAFEYSP